MKEQNYSFVYGVGTNAKTKEFYFSNAEFLKPIETQKQLSFPLITSFTLNIQKEKQEGKTKLFSIYVGKEININQSIFYEIDKKEVQELRKNGYKKACLLNYKEDNQILVGLNEQDKVVENYRKLKMELLKIKKVIS